MQAIILTAGKGVRFRPFSLTRPKPLFSILGQSLLEHNLDHLNGLVEEVILVVGYKGRLIKKQIGSQYKKLKIKYVFQKKQLGTGDAAKSALPFIKNRFLLLNGDDLYPRSDIKKVLAKFPSILAKPVKNPKSFGVIVAKNGVVKSLVEKPEKPLSNLANTGLYHLDKKIFQYKIKKSSRGEYEFTDYLKKFIRYHKLYLVKASGWLPVSFPWNLSQAVKLILKEEKSLNQGKIDKSCYFKGKVIIKEGTIIKKNVYLEGPLYIGKNCFIDASCYLKGPLSIGDNVYLGQAVQIKNSVIGNNTRIGQLDCINDSVIDNNCFLGDRINIASFYQGNKTVKTKIKNKFIDTGQKRLGALIGKNVHINQKNFIYPGIKIWPNQIIPANQKVARDIKNGYKKG